MGTFPGHSSSVPLVLCPDTGAISPQFHVAFDDWFVTIATSAAELPDFGSPPWEQLFGDSLSFYENKDVEEEQEAPAPSMRETQVSNSMDLHCPLCPLPVEPPAAAPGPAPMPASASPHHVPPLVPPTREMPQLPTSVPQREEQAERV